MAVDKTAELELMRSRVFSDTGPEGRSFYGSSISSIDGYNGFIVKEGKLVALINMEDQNVPQICLGQELIIKGNSQGYVSYSQVKPGDRVTVVGFRDPAFDINGDPLAPTDEIIQVQPIGSDESGWIKPSEHEDLENKRDTNPKENITMNSHQALTLETRK